VWFALTVTLIVVPLVIINVFSIVWFHQDHENHSKGFLKKEQDISNAERVFLVLSHLLLLGPAVR
jgi:hypothetical protein